MADKNYEGLQAIIDDLSDMLLPPERISVSDAAAKYRKVYNPPVVNALWDNEIAPYMREIMDTLESRDYTSVCVVAAAQSLKSEAGHNWYSYTIRCDPSDFMIVEKNQQEARIFSITKLDRTLRHSPELASRLIKRRSADNTFDKRFTSGAILNLAWPTVNAASGKTIRRVWLTDYDRMPQDLGEEGSPYDLFSQRTKVFKRLGMTYVESSPSFDVIDPSWRAKQPHEAPPCEGILGIYNRGDRRRRYWQCPHCRDWFEPGFNLLRWPQSEDLMECAEGVYMACPHCFEASGAIILPHMRQEIDTTGRWIRAGERLDKEGKVTGTPRRSEIASFWLKGPATAFGSWKSMVLKYLQALDEYEHTGNDRPLKTTVNTDQGEAYIPPQLRDARTPEDIMSRALDLDARKVPEGVRFLVATIDVQKHKFCVQVQGVKPAAETIDLIVIDRFDIIKSARLDDDGERYPVSPHAFKEDWELLVPQVIEKSYPLSDGSGRRMSIRMTACDSGGKLGATPRAYEFYRHVKTLGHGGRFRLVKGGAPKGAPRVHESYPDSDRKDRHAGARGEIPVLMLHSDMLKDWVDAALTRGEPGAGNIEFPDWLTIDYFKELCAEVRSPKGQWENTRKLRNEAWDLLCYAYALCIYLRAEKIDWAKPQAKWAAEWDDNVLVFSEGPGVKMEVKQDRAERLRKLAERLG